MKIEIWKDIPIPTLTGKYEASSFGKVRHLKRKKVLTGNIDKDGYRYLTLMTTDGQRSFKEHRLVASAFNGVSSQQIDHINNNKLDNRPENLQYCDNTYNCQKRSRLKFGTETNINWHKGKKRYQVRITRYGRRVNVGHFKDKESAITAYQNALS